MLRTDLFKTVDRVRTRFIAIRDTLTKPGLDADIKVLDAIHCKQGRLGVGWHFVVLTEGTIQLGRDVDTCGAHSKGLDDISVAVGVVGGVDEEGQRLYTRTPDQEDALRDLIEVLAARYPEAELSDNPAKQGPAQ